MMEAATDRKAATVMDEELQRYRTDQAEAWLMKVRKAVGYAKALEESAAYHFAAADNLKSMDYSAIRVTTSPTPDQIPNAVIAHIEAGKALGEVAASASERIAQAARALSQMDDATEAMCLQLYYVDALETWEHVCVRMHYTYDGMMKLRRRALLHAYDVMPHVERDAIPTAL